MTSSRRRRGGFRRRTFLRREPSRLHRWRDRRSRRSRCTQSRPRSRRCRCTRRRVRDWRRCTSLLRGLFRRRIRPCSLLGLHPSRRTRSERDSSPCSLWTRRRCRRLLVHAPARLRRPFRSVRGHRRNASPLRRRKPRRNRRVGRGCRRRSARMRRGRRFHTSWGLRVGARCSRTWGAGHRAGQAGQGTPHAKGRL